MLLAVNVPLVVAAAILALGIVAGIYLAARRYRLGEKFKERARNVEDDLREANKKLDRRSRPLDPRRVGRRLRRAAKRKRPLS